jgi:predicted GH43/DUF377 family glycosyl hydrolase
MSTQTTHRYWYAYSDVIYPNKREEQGVPNIYAQAENLGGTFTRITKGLPRDTLFNFSPSLVRHENNTYIAWRGQTEPFGFRYDSKYFYLNGAPTDIYIGILAEDNTIIGAKKLRPNKHRLSYEDPRLFVGPDNNLYVQFVASTYASRFDSKKNTLFQQPKVVVCYIDENLNAVQAAIPPIGNNWKKDQTEKNWCFFSHKNELNCLYSTRPLVIERENGESLVVDTSVLDETTGKTPTFNSTAPINLGYGHLIFYHWKHLQFKPDGMQYLQYHLGAYIVDREFKEILYTTKEPLFSGSLNDKLISWTDYAGTPVSTQPAVILPFSAHLENDELVMPLGVNDAYMGIFRCPLATIMKKMERVA